MIGAYMEEKVIGHVMAIHVDTEFSKNCVKNGEISSGTQASIELKDGIFSIREWAVPKSEPEKMEIENKKNWVGPNVPVNMCCGALSPMVVESYTLFNKEQASREPVLSQTENLPTVKELGMLWSGGVSWPSVCSGSISSGQISSYLTSGAVVSGSIRLEDYGRKAKQEPTPATKVSEPEKQETKTPGNWFAVVTKGVADWFPG